MTTIAAVLSAVRDVIEGEPFGLLPANDPFDFDLNPAASRDAIYRLEPVLRGREGYAGPYAMEQWTVDIWVARQRRGSVGETYDRLLNELSDLSVALIEAGLASDEFNVPAEGQELEVQRPDGDEVEYLVARLHIGVDFDRAL